MARLGKRMRGNGHRGATGAKAEGQVGNASGGVVTWWENYLLSGT